jgi:hypothetical protein
VPLRCRGQEMQCAAYDYSFLAAHISFGLAGVHLELPGCGFAILIFYIVAGIKSGSAGVF